jgi:hypothetical protein
VSILPVFFYIFSVGLWNCSDSVDFFVLSPIRRGFAPGFVKYDLKKGCTRLAAASDKAYQLLAHDW